MNNNQFTIILENGSEQVCDFLFKFNDEDTNKNYIFFQIVASGVCDVVEFFEDDNKEIQLQPVTDENTRLMLNDVLNEFNSQSGCCGGGCGCSSEEDHECCGGCSDEKEEHTCCGGCK